MKRLLAMAAVAVIWSASTVCRAGSLDPAVVAGDAKWLVHVDFDALHASKVAQHARDELMKRPRIKETLDKVQEATGMNLEKDLHGLTAYGDGFKPHSGVVIALAHFNRDKLVALMKTRPDFKSTSDNGLELYSWTEGSGDRKHDVIVAFPKDGMAVIAGSAEQVKRATGVLRSGGLASSLLVKGQDPPGTIFRVEVAGVGDADLPIKIDMLKKIDHVSLLAGENDGTNFDHVRITTTDEETAKQLKSIADGIKSMVDLRLDKEPDLKKTVDATKVEQSGKTVSIDWSGSSDSVIQMIDRARDEVIKRVRERGAAADEQRTRAREELQKARERIRERRENREGSPKDADKKDSGK
jgi:CBS domain-containing protein